METDRALDAPLQETSSVARFEATAPPAAAANRLDVVWDVAWLRPALAVGSIVALFVFYVSQHIWQCDDAFISYRYVRNLVLGNGLVFNIGERVEGYTNFLWVLELAAIWKLFGLHPEHSNYVLSGLYTAGTLFVTAQLAQRTPFAKHKLVAACGALFFLAINRTFVVWTTSGLETRQFTFFVVLAIWLMQREPQPRAVLRYLPASLAWAAAELTRPEGPLLFACGGLWLLGGAATRGRLRPLELVGYGAPFLLVTALHFGFRHAYYGEWFPNTYYAKDVRAWPEAGFMYMAEAVIENGVYVIAPVAAVGLVARVVLAQDGVHVLAALCVLLHAAYLIRIGGDHFEYRPLDFYWPLWSVAVTDGLLALRTLVARACRRWDKAHASALGWVAGLAAAVLLAVYSTILQLAHISLTHDYRNRAESFRLDAEITRDAFPLAFMLPGMQTLTEAYNSALRYTSQHSIGIRYQEHRLFWRHQLELFGAYQGKADNLFPADAVMQFSTVGIMPYSLPNLTIIDALGLTDSTIARNPVLQHNRDRQLAHDRFPPEGYLERRGVNLEVLPSTQFFGLASEFAIQLDKRLWMPLLSTDADWLLKTFSARGLWHKHLTVDLPRNVVWANGRALIPERALGFFDQPQAEHWLVQGQVGVGAPVNPIPGTQPIGFVGVGLIDTFDPQTRDRARGEVRSPTFYPKRNEYLAFLIAGGNDPKVGVQLLVGGKVSELWRGHDTHEMSFVAVDLSRYAGKTCQIRVFDESSAGWGHIAADHFMLLESL